MLGLVLQDENDPEGESFSHLQRLDSNLHLALPLQVLKDESPDDHIGHHQNHHPHLGEHEGEEGAEEGLDLLDACPRLLDLVVIPRSQLSLPR